MHFRTVSGDESWFSLPDINCARVLVSKTLVQSDGDRGYDGGRNDDGFNSSSLALTTVESFEGNRLTSLLSSPVIYQEKDKLSTIQVCILWTQSELKIKIYSSLDSPS